VPANDADFELLGLALLKAHWNCPTLELYAHRGEKQFGIDILDLSGNEPLSAAQCKLHDEWKTIPPKEIRNEVQKAKGFGQKLGRYAILTTAKASRTAHDAVLKINLEHRRQGLYQLELITWGKIESLLDKYDAVREEFDSTFGAKTSREIKEKLSAIHEAVVSKSPLPDTDLTPPSPPAPLPKADPRRFAIGLAHLIHDDRQELERLVVESLRDLAGIQILQFDRTLSAEGAVPEASERDAHEMARALLHESMADVLLWGTVLSHDGRTATRFYWTTRATSTRSKQPYLPENFQLPELFWEDLVEVLRLLVVTQSAELFAREGQHIAAELTPFVDKVRNLVKPSKAARGWSPRTIAQVTFILAMALEQLGEHTGRRDYLAESVTCYRETLSRWLENEVPEYWAAARNNLGVALAALGSLESDDAHLLEAEAIFRDLIKRVASRERTPIFWAILHNNLGNSLLQLGIRESGAEKLEGAAKSYSIALRKWTRERFPLDWATLQNNLGLALQEAGARGSRPELLSAAINAHRGALEGWTRDKVPMYWARAQNNLGNALKRLGEHQPGIELFEQAANHFRLALMERALEREPLAWGETQSNLGSVLIEIADRVGNQTGLREAVTALRESLKVRTREAAPLAFASSKNNLGYALVRLGEFENEVFHFEEAIAAFRDALQVWTRDKAPAQWSVAQHNLGDATRSLAKREKSSGRLNEAIAAYDQALAERPRDRQAVLWAVTQAALGFAYYVRGEWEPDTVSLETSVSYYRSALEEYRKDIVPFARSGAQFNFGNVLRLLGQRNQSAALVCEALENHAAACRDSLRYSPYWAFRAAESAEEDMKVLEATCDRPTFERVLLKHGWILALRAKHASHAISLMPVFTAVVPGTSGTTRPDFSSASMRGDRVKDGSVVWENKGKYSYCTQCGEFLIAPE